jgi:8-oxo-dGTP pyrophosphatase MutT (NUDIX family)
VRRAAVAVLFCREHDQWVIPLTVRSDQLARHRGQVSFPGGLIDAGESPAEAAAREVAEELGQAPSIDWLAELPGLYVFASCTMVSTQVGSIDHWPVWRANPNEVARVLRLPVRRLVGGAIDRLTVRRGPLTFMAPCLEVEGYSVWGSTAILLGELRGRLRRVTAEDGRESNAR